jgi:hypothetical protein
MSKQDEIDRQKVILYTWVAKAFYKKIKSFKVPEKYVEAAKDIASQGNGFRFVDGVLSWD